MNESNNNQIAIEATGLVKHFGETRAVDGVDLTVPTGTVTALLGPNGAGKTTTVRILTTLLRPDGGSATVAGVDLAKNPNDVRAKIGLTGQDTAVDELLTGRENLVMIGRLARMSADDAKARAEELLTRFELQDAGDRNAGTYSGGMRRRLDLASSMIAGPEILFLDEPTTGLDPRSRLGMWEQIEELVEGGTTVLLTTQYLDEADKLADEIVVIDHGKVIARGTSAELKVQVGGERLEFTFEDEATVDRATALLHEGGIEIGDRDEEAHSLTIGLTDGASQVARLIDRVEGGGISISEVFVHRPTLDDVFLKLTGEHVEHSDEDNLEESR
ncbi:MAG: ATP-binding cassette domain-containing protein [Solirubrobacterales bacterium]